MNRLKLSYPVDMLYMSMMGYSFKISLIVKYTYDCKVEEKIGTGLQQDEKTQIVDNYVEILFIWSNVLGALRGV